MPTSLPSPSQPATCDPALVTSQTPDKAPMDNPAIPAPITHSLPPSALPSPTYHLPDPNKKSHARRKAPGHVPRPRNPFILFRCDFVRQQKVPSDVEKDHRNLSRIAGSLWQDMRDDQKEPWVEMARQEKERHERMWPGYRYTPAGRRVKLGGDKKGRKKRGDSQDGKHPTKKTPAFKLPLSIFTGTIPLDFTAGIAFPGTSQETLSSTSYVLQRRSSSCPPGDPRFTIFYNDAPGALPRTMLVTRDDLTRRPSLVTKYQAVVQESIAPISPGLAHLSTTSAMMYNLGGKALDVRPVLRTGAYADDYGIPGWGGVCDTWDSDRETSDIFSAYTHLLDDDYSVINPMPTFTDPFATTTSPCFPYNSTSSSNPSSSSVSFGSHSPASHPQCDFSRMSLDDISLAPSTF